MKLGIEIVNALSSKKMFLPDDFFAVPAGPARNLQQVSTERTQQHTLQPVTAQVQQRPLDAHAAALARREWYSAKSKPDSNDGVKTISIPKISREEAAQRKAQALANIEQIAATAQTQSPTAEWFANKPSLAEDVIKSTGKSIAELERMVDPE